MGSCIFCNLTITLGYSGRTEPGGRRRLRQAGGPSQAAHVRRQQAAQGIALASSMTRCDPAGRISPLTQRKVVGRFHHSVPRALARRFVILRPRLGGGSQTRRASDAGSLLLGVLRYFLRPGQARLRARRASARWRPRSLESSRRRGSNRPADAEPGFIRQGVHRWRRSSSVRHGRRASSRLSNRGRAGWSFAARACRLSRPRVQSPGGVGFGLRAGAFLELPFPLRRRRRCLRRSVPPVY